jgi:hypothetical protein
MTNLKNDIYFLAFANENYYDSLKRIKIEAESINIFDKVLIYTDKDLIQFKDFWEKHKNFILNNYRGHGYWIWKSYLTLKTLESMNDNDILVYADAGCTINKDGVNRLKEYFNIVNENDNGNISFEMEFIEKEWTKMDIFNYFDMNNNIVLNSGQLNATAFILRKCSNTVFIVNEWYNAMNNYNLIDDSQSILKNDDSFQENRHDQSIFSLIRKKYGTTKISDETSRYIWSPEKIKEFPINKKI